MKLAAEVRLPFPRETVFAAYRDRIAQILEFLPSVRTVEALSRQEESGVVLSSSDWYGGGEVPATVRGIITQSMLRWTSRARWDAGSFQCDWRAEAYAFPEGVRCRGRTSFVDEPEGRTLLDVQGAVEVDARRLPGIPGHLKAPVGRSVEEFLVKRIGENLVETSQWFEKYRAMLPEAR